MVSGANLEGGSMSLCPCLCFEFWHLTHTLTHTRKNCVETVGGIPLDTISTGIKNAKILPDSTL